MAATDVEGDIEQQIDAASLSEGNHLLVSEDVNPTSTSQPPKSRPQSIVIARVAGVVLLIYFLMTILGQLPTNNPQEDLPDKDPVEAQQIFRNDNGSQVTSGTAAIRQDTNGDANVFIAHEIKEIRY